MKLQALFLIVQAVVMIPVGIFCIAFFLGFVPSGLGPFGFVVLAYSVVTMLATGRWDRIEARQLT